MGCKDRKGETREERQIDEERWQPLRPLGLCVCVCVWKSLHYLRRGVVSHGVMDTVVELCLLIKVTEKIKNVKKD